MLQGLLDSGFPPERVTVLDPHPSDWHTGLGIRRTAELPADKAIVLVAVKPQMMTEALPRLAPLGNGGTLFLTVAAGTALSFYEWTLGAQTPVIRAMPNTPAAVGRGITAIVGNATASAADMDLAEHFLSAVGQVVRLDSEEQMDAVTALSGSGPAYVFHLVEAMAQAGIAQGLPEDLAMDLARATVAGAGELLHRSEESAAQLRINVTSPKGTTEAALNQLMRAEDGLPAVMKRAVAAATERSRELGK
ncbi:MAG: pyrroline-5-carboxylate reductase [Tropicimonas sp.]|uniref:pyrroline-5-carboxylate reductase n=1 Tax=Tropicimonas sp. TaxID=2067044 RepID=UPI003A854332